MPLLATDIIFRKSRLISDLEPAQNGGRMSATAIADGVKNALFPDVTQAMRDAGATTWRKVFIHMANGDTTAMTDARACLAGPSPAGTYVLIYPGTASDTEADITSSYRPYGVGTMTEAINPGATSIILAGEDPEAYAIEQPFRVGDAIRIAEGAAEHFDTLLNVVYNVDNTITLTLQTGVGQSFTAAAVVTSLVQASSIAASVDGLSVTSTAGTLDPAGIELTNKGAIEETWTLTFTTATDYTLTAVGLGEVGTGNTASDLAPINPDMAVPYLTLRSTGFGGTFAAGDGVTFSTRIAALPLWYKRVTPPGTSTAANDGVAVNIMGEVV